MKGFKVLILFFLSLGTVYSCSDDPCRLETQSLLSLEVNVIDTNLTKINFADSLAIYSPSWTDSIHFSEENSKNIVSFMLSPTDSITTIIFTAKNDTLKDTLYIYHQNNVKFLSTECGFVVDYKIDTTQTWHTWNLIDSTFVVKDKITTDEKGLIQIYF